MVFISKIPTTCKAEIWSTLSNSFNKRGFYVEVRLRAYSQIVSIDGKTLSLEKLLIFGKVINLNRLSCEGGRQVTMNYTNTWRFLIGLIHSISTLVKILKSSVVEQCF